MVITAHPDDAEVQMGGTIAKMAKQGLSLLIVDMCDGEPTDYAEPGVRVKQAHRAAKILGADRLILEEQDRLLTLYEAEDIHMGRLFGVAQAEVFKAHSPLLVDDLTVFKPGLHG